MRRVWLLAPLLLPVVGCAPGNCDPSQAGFFDGISCQTSGAYDRRQTQLQNNVSAARANLYRQQSFADSAAADADAAQTQRDKAVRDLQSIARENAVLKARLVAASRREGADRSLIAQRQAELSRLERDRSALQQHGADPAQVQQLESRRRALVEAASQL